MKKISYHILTLLLLISSCTENKRANDNQKLVLTENDTTHQVILSDSLVQDIIKDRADRYINSILDTNAVQWTFNPADKPEYLDIFLQDGIATIYAYSHKNYPQKSKPTDYNHFVLFLIKYKTNELAKNSFDRFISDTEIDDIEQYKENHEMFDRLMRIYFISKYGGLVGQKQNYIMSLVETCSDNYQNQSWTTYEDYFIKNIFDKSDKGLTILNADCGKMKYIKQTIN